MTLPSSPTGPPGFPGTGRAVVARVVEAEGLGPRPARELLVVTEEGTAGSLLGGTADGAATTAARQLLADPAAGPRVVGVELDDPTAISVGLTCGGRVGVLVQYAADLAAELWSAVDARRPAALVTRLGSPGATLLVRAGATPIGSVGDAALDELAMAEAGRALRGAGASARRVAQDDVELVVEGWGPVPRLVLVGPSQLAEALVRQAELLGWEATVTDGADASLAQVGELGPADAVLVMDHAPAVATPVLADALVRGVGYVGTLGSRRTQNARRAHLLNAGVNPFHLARLRGPAGLDLGGGTPAETAVAVAAEILAVRSGREARPLSAGSGPINA